MPASSSAIRAGRAFVELFTKDDQLRKGLGRAQKMVADFAKRVEAVGAGMQAMGRQLLAIGTVAAAPFALAIKSASDLEETMNKFNVVFGDSAAGVKLWGDEFAASVGRSKRQIADFLAGTQDLLVPLGFDSAAATDFSKQIAGLAIDLASFNNMADASVLRDLHAALTGSGETMKKYGVIVSEAAVKQELFNQSIDPSKATEQEKVQSRLNIILRGTTAAQGDAIRSASGFANQMKALQGSIEDVAAAVGSALLPVVTPLLGQAAELVKKFGEWAQQNKDLVVDLAALTAGSIALGAALSALGGAVTLAGKGIAFLAAPIKLIAGVLAAIASPVGIVVAAIAAVAAGIAAVVATTMDWNAIWQTIQATAEPILANLKELALNLWDAFKGFVGWLDEAFAAIFGSSMGDVATNFLTGVIKGIETVTEKLAVLTNDWEKTWAFLKEVAVSAMLAAATLIADALAMIVPGISLAADKLRGMSQDANAARDKAMRAMYDQRDKDVLARNRADVAAFNEAQRQRTAAAAEKELLALADAARAQEDAANRATAAAQDQYEAALAQLRAASLLEETLLNLDPHHRNTPEQDRTALGLGFDDETQAWFDQASADMDDALEEQRRETQRLLERMPETLTAGSEAAAKAMLDNFRDSNPQMKLAERQARAAEEANRHLGNLEDKFDRFGKNPHSWAGLPVTAN